MQFREVRKSFNDVHALKGVSFDVPAASIFGLLGPNGAGKTTLIRIITKIFAADSGTIYFNGVSIKEQQYAAIGYMPEEKGLYKKMRVGEHLIYLARLKGMRADDAKKRIYYWFEKLEVPDWWNKKIEDLSKGMQQKVQFIATVLHEPKLLILDEPFSGLDPVNTEMIKNEIYHLNQQGVTILFSTHRMEQVEEICNDIVLINKGNVVIEGAVKEIKNTFRKNLFELTLNTESVIEDTALFHVVKNDLNTCRIQVNTDVSNNMVLQYFIDNGLQISTFKEILPSLHEVFISLVKSNEVA